MINMMYSGFPITDNVILLPWKLEPADLLVPNRQLVRDLSRQQIHKICSGINWSMIIKSLVINEPIIFVVTYF